MSPERWQQVEEIFSEAVDLPAGAERAALLAARCGSDEELRAEVEKLIAADEAAGDFIAKPAFDVRQVTAIEQKVASAALTEIDTPMTGRRIGSYKVVREIGRGGMGSVYLAVRADDEFHKRVAIKLVKRGMDTDFVLKRFRNERQILASLDHPNIAHLLDGGTTEDGLPYFVMEFIQGQPIDRYCDNARLALAERLKLFRQVCSAVHYAHQNLIIHRDIKPSNILVTADGAPKLLDFGIAKILNPDIAIDTIDPTLTAMRMMTPKYASPEQLRGGVATNLSDIYSLGVLLYELLTGRHPYRLRRLPPHEVARLICEQDPERPSLAITRLEEPEEPDEESESARLTPELVGRTRSTTPEALSRDLSRGLDQIVMKAMRKEPHLRYSSVEEFSEDVRRYLEGSPVTAPAYFPVVRKTDGGEAPTAQKSIAVLPFKLLHTAEGEDTGDFLGIGLADALITRLSNTRALVVRPTSAVMKFAKEGDPVSAGQQLAVDYVLDGHILHVGDRVRVSVQLIGTRQSAPLWAAHFDEGHADILALHDSLSEKVSKALVPQLTGEERRRLARRGTNSPEAYEAYLRGRLHWNSMAEDGFAKAILYFNEAAVIDPSYAAPHSGIADYYNWLGVLGVLPSEECYGAAKEAATRAAALDPSLPEAYTALGFACHAQWDWDASDRHLRRAIELNPNHAPAHQWYSFHLTSLGRFDEAEAEARRAQQLDPNAAAFHQSFAFVLYLARRYEECLAENELVYKLDPDYPLSLYVESRALCALGRFEEALRPARKACERSGNSPLYMGALGYASALAGHEEEARAILTRLGEMSKTRHVSQYHVALIHIALGEYDKAFARLEEAFEQREAWLVWIRVETPLDPLRSDPRFESLLGRVCGAATERNRATETVLGGQAAALLPPAVPTGSRAADPTLRLRASGPGAHTTGVHVSDTEPRPTDDDEAYTLYKVGRYYSTKRTADDLRKAIERFEHAVVRDPRFALAYAELADCYSLLNWYAEPPPDGAWDLARRAARNAVEADDKLPEAHASLGFVLLHYDRDWAGAEREFRRAIELKADNAPGHRWLALCLSAQGRHEEAITEIMRAREILPRSAVAASAAANILFFAERYEEALAQCYAAMEIDPGSLSTHIILRWCYERLGMCDEALAVFEQERAFAGDTPMTRAKQAHVLASCGQKAEAREVVRDLVLRRAEQWVTAYEIAVIYALLGEPDKAFDWLDRAEQEHAVGLTYVGVDPRINSLREDPRFRELMTRVSRGANAGQVEPGAPQDGATVAATATHTTGPLATGTTGANGTSGAATQHGATAAAGALTTAANSPATAAYQRNFANGNAALESVSAVRSPATAARPERKARRRRRGYLRPLGAVAAVLLIAAMVAGLYFYFNRPTSRSVAFRGAQPVRITTSGNVRNAALSPDGKIVAYVVDEGGRRGLWARQVAISNSVRLVPPSDFTYFGLAFSRDGTFLYFVAAERDGQRGDLYRVPALGGSLQKLRAGVDSPVGMSHDGKRLAFVVREAEQGHETIYVTDADGTGERAVASRKFPEHFSVNSAPAWSKDDQRLGMVVESSDSNGFFMKAVEIEIDGGAERPLTDVRWSGFSQMRWLKNDAGLVLTANDGNSSMTQLWYVSYPEGVAERLTHDLNDYRGLSLSEDSGQLLTVQNQTLTNVFLAQRGDYARPVQITSGAGRYVDLSWTPEGRILFATDASGNSDIWEMAADGGDHVQLTAGAGRNYGPTATPDGRYVLFHSNRSGKWQVWRMARDGSNPVRLTREDSNSNWPAVSPDGRWVIYERTGEGALTNLYKIPVEGGEPMRLTRQLSLRPAVSPDGRWIAHWYKGEGPNAPWQIALTPIEGGPPERIFDVPQNEADGNSSIRWTGDSRAIIYTDYRDGVTNLRLQPIEGGPARQITNATREVFYSFDLAPDGRLLLANGLVTSDVVLFTQPK
jgi:serine/threonine protein kinase/Tol biopolymer transport system component/tetratricopeptide (TPR) repeat protein